jgi:uncharacterized membrane protein
MFATALLSDISYFVTPEIQWKNFATWLIAGGLVFGGLALLWALIDLFRARRGARPIIYFLLLLIAWPLGFINELLHAKDAWATMPEGLVTSAIVAALVIVATILGFSSLRAGEIR